MEPISLIIAALVAATAEVAVEAAPDAYNALKTLIKRKFAGEPKAEMVWEEYETAPQIYEAPLKQKLIEAGVDQDEDIIKAAEELLKQLKPEEFAAGKYNTEFQAEVKVAQIGDGNTQTNTLGS